MKNKLLAGIMALAIMLSQTTVLGAVEVKNEEFVQAETVELMAETLTEGDWDYTVNEDDTVTITGWNGDDAELTIPSELGGKKVTVIGDGVFRRCYDLISVEISDTITSIGHRAFENCRELTYIEIPINVQNIGNYVFQGCDNLVELYVEEDNQYYESYDNMLIDKTKNELLYCATASDGDKYIPDGIQKIHAYAFENCNEILYIEIPESVTEIGENAFYGCTSLEEIVIPESVTEIKCHTFWNCKNLMIVELPTMLTIIEDGAFGQCRSLEEIVLSDNVSYIGDNVFKHCDKLVAIELSENNKNFIIENGVLFNKDKTELIYCVDKDIQTYVMPDSISVIKGGAFTSCDSLESVKCSENAISIGDYAFSGCAELVDIELSDKITNIGGGAFDITGYYEDETNWENKCLYLGEYLIAAKANIAECIIKDGTVLIADDVFAGIRSLTNMQIPDSVCYIGDDAFNNCYYLTNIKIPDSVLDIGDSAFYGCYYLINIEIPGSIANIGEYTFFGCRSLESVKLLNGVSYIGECAFSSCDDLQYIIIPKSVEFIDEDVFLGSNDEMIIYGEAGSYAEEYAEENGYEFISAEFGGDEDLESSVKISPPTPTYTDNTVAVPITITNTTDKPSYINAYVAAYTESGEMLGVELVNITDAEYSCDISIAVAEKPAYVKVFAIDSIDGVSPLCEAQKANVE